MARSTARQKHAHSVPRSLAKGFLAARVSPMWTKIRAADPRVTPVARGVWRELGDTWEKIWLLGRISHRFHDRLVRARA